MTDKKSRSLSENIGEIDMDELFKEIRTCPDPVESARLAKEARDILEKKSRRLIDGQDGETEQEKRIREGMEEALLHIMRNAETRRGPSPLDVTKVSKNPLIALGDEFRDINASSENRGNEEETETYSQSTIARVLNTENGKGFSLKGIVPVLKRTEDSGVALVAKILYQDRPEVSGIQELERMASESTGDSTAIMLAQGIVKSVALDETPLPNDPNEISEDSFEAEETKVEETFSVVCNNIATLKFIDDKNAENIFRKFVYKCQIRTNGGNEMSEVLAILKKNFEEVSAENKEVFIELLVRIIDRPGKDSFLASMAAKGSEHGAWKPEINIILEDFLGEIDPPTDDDAAFFLPTMDSAFALSQAREEDNAEQLYAKIVEHALKYKSEEKIISIFSNELDYLEINEKDAHRESLMYILEEKAAQLLHIIEIEILRRKAIERSKIKTLTKKKEPEVHSETLNTAEIIAVGNEVQEKGKPSFLSRNKSKIASILGGLGIIGALGYEGSQLFGKKESKNEENPFDGLVTDLDPKPLANSAIMGGVSGAMVKENLEPVADSAVESSFKDYENMSAGIVSGALSGLKKADKKDIESKVADSSKNWKHEVKSGDTFFGVVNNWRAFNDFSSLQSKYPFLNRLDNWDLATAMRMVSNKKNKQNRHLDVYKGSDQNAQDVFDATFYEMFMEIYKFRSRSQRNFVIKHMEEGGDFEEILHAINEGKIGIEGKKTYTKRKDQMRGRYSKSRGTANDASLSMENMDSLFSFKSESARGIIMDLMASGAQIGEIFDTIKKGYVLDCEKGIALELGISVKDVELFEGLDSDRAPTKENLALLDTEELGLEKISDDGLAILDNEEIGLEIFEESDAELESALGKMMTVNSDLPMLDNEAIGLEAIDAELMMLDNEAIGLEAYDEELSLAKRMEMLNKGWDDIEIEMQNSQKIDKAWDEILEEITLREKSIEEIQEETFSESLRILS